MGLELDNTTQKINAQPSASSIVPNIQIPGYKIIRELGHGGMAHVYLAIQESFGREVALKVLSPHLTDDDQFSKRFLREARIVSQLNHPNIVTVYDAGVHEKYHYMSMEYIPGKDLKQLKDSTSREEAIRIVKDVAGALDFVGKKGIVHRDIKPENIMIHQSDNRVILMDFGIAHGDDVTQGMTQTGKAIGTPHFMSPEQTKGLKVDHRSDIYSLGVVLFQLLSGNLPFDADSAVAVGIKHLTSPIPLLPGGLEIFQPIVNHCLSKQPQHRYQKAAELIAALENITNEQLENINTQAVIFKNAGADHDAETQIGEVPIKQKRKIPELVFPSRNKITVDEDAAEVEAPSTLRRNLLVLLLIVTAIYGANEKQKELTSFWAYEALPKIAEVFPNLFPKSYSEYWAKKLEPIKTKTVTPVMTSTGTTEIAATEQNTNGLVASTDSPNALETTTKFSQNKQTPNQAQIKAQSKKDKLTLLKEEINKNPKAAIELASYYKDLLIQDKQNETARQGLNELREWYIKQISLAFATEDAIQARQLISMMQQSFPRATKSKRFIRLEKKVAFLERLKSHFDIAEKYFNAGALSKPLNKNALSEINKVLALSPNNEDAKNFINKIVNSYLEKTTQLQQQGNIQNAIFMVEEGIAALNDPLLVNKRKQLKETIKHNKNISLLFKKAKKYLDADQLIRPTAYNSYDIYLQILERESANLQAKAGVRMIHQLLAKKITAAISKGNLELSQDYLQAAIQRYGRTPLLGRVQLKLNDALDAILPRIDTLKLSNMPVTGLIKKNPDNLTLNLKQTLYIGINYINFDPKTTWLDVTLFNKTKNNIEARKPLVISSQFGEHFFELDGPVKGFSHNNYKVEIKLKDRTLISKSFSAKN